MVSTYGLALEYDLAHELPGIDLGELWRSRQWRKLLNFIDHLPSHTHFYALISQDEKHAEMLLEAQDQAPSGLQSSPGPSMTTWTPEVNLLASIFDALNGVRTAVIAGAGGKPDRPTPYPRPKTALEKVKARRRQQKHDRLSALLVPREQD